MSIDSSNDQLGSTCNLASNTGSLITVGLDNLGNSFKLEKLYIFSIILNIQWYVVDAQNNFLIDKLVMSR